MNARTDLVDNEGENRAVRSFLLMYGGAAKVVITQRMRDHMEMSGWAGCWPGWVDTARDGKTLTKAGAQLWIRHLLAMEQATARIARADALEEAELRLTGSLPDTPVKPLTRCASHQDGDCYHAECPQLRDNEPASSGRHCPLDTRAKDEQ